MRCTIKAKCTKQEFLSYTHSSLKCTYKSGFTYGFYNLKAEAEKDKYRLNFSKIQSEILKGWKLDRINLKDVDSI